MFWRSSFVEEDKTFRDQRKASQNTHIGKHLLKKNFRNPRKNERTRHLKYLNGNR